MSKYIKSKKARAMAIVAFAVAAVALMLAAPILSSVDTDAALTEDKAGASLVLVNPTDAELQTYLNNSRLEVVSEASEPFSRIFNQGAFNQPTVVTSSLTCKNGMGEKITSDSAISIMDVETFADGVTMTTVANASAPLISEEFCQKNPEYAAAGNAIKAYFGETLNAGDQVSITGKINNRAAIYITIEYAPVSDSTSVVKKATLTSYTIYDIDVKIALNKATSADVKEIQFRSDLKVMQSIEGTYDYKGTAYSDLTDQSPCTIKRSAPTYNFKSGGTHYTVNGSDYSIELPAGKESTDETHANITNNSDINLNSMKESIAKIPASSGNATVDKSFEAAESLYTDVVLGVVGQEIENLLIIIGAVVIGVIVVVVVLVIVLVRRKR